MKRRVRFLLPLMALCLASVVQASAPAVPAVVTAAIAASAGDGIDRGSSPSRPLLLYFYRDSCGYCRRMKRETFADERVKKYFEESVSFHRLDGDDRRVGSLTRKLKIVGFPTCLLMDSDGRVLGKVMGFRPVEKFLALIESQQKKTAEPASSSGGVQNLVTLSRIYDILSMAPEVGQTDRRLRLLASGRPELDSAAWWDLADLYNDRDENEPGITAYQTFLAVTPPDDSRVPRALYYVARLAQAMGEGDLAKVSYCQLVSRFPRGTYSDRAREKMADLGVVADPPSNR